MTSLFDEVAQSFYRSPDVPGALVAFDAFLVEKEPIAAMLHAFTHMARVNADVRAGIEARRAVAPQVVDAVLNGEAPPVRGALPGPEDLDLLWTEFFITGNLEPVRHVIGVLDEPDLVRQRLTAWLRDVDEETFTKFVPLFQRCAFPIVFSEARVEGPVDLDLTVAIAARNGQLKFSELPFPLSQPELLRIASKAAAIWSLRALSNEHPTVAKLCADEALKPGGAARLLMTR